MSHVTCPGPACWWFMTCFLFSFLYRNHGSWWFCTSSRGTSCPGNFLSQWPTVYFISCFSLFSQLQCFVSVWHSFILLTSFSQICSFLLSNDTGSRNMAGKGIFVVGSPDNRKSAHLTVLARLHVSFLCVLSCFILIRYHTARDEPITTIETHLRSSQGSSQPYTAFCQNTLHDTQF